MSSAWIHVARVLQTPVAFYTALSTALIASLRRWLAKTEFI